MHGYEFLFPYEHIPCGSKIILYGAGHVGVHYMRQILLTGYCTVVGFADKKAKYLVGGIVPIYSLKELHGLDFDYIVVSVQFKQTYEQILASLRDEGFPKEKIIYVEPRILPPYDPPISVDISTDIPSKEQNLTSNNAHSLKNPDLMHDMKIVTLMGGLGNQLYQYIFARYIEMISGKNLIFDDMYYFLVDKSRVHGGLLVLEDIFPVKIKKLSEVLSSDWEAMIQKVKNGTSIWKQLLDAGINVDMLSDAEGVQPIRYGMGKAISYSSEALFEVVHKLGGDNTYYFGYWQSDCMKILRDDVFKKKLVEELQFPSFSDHQNKSYAERMQKEDSAAIHIRRGDFVSLGWETIPEYYKQCISLMERNYCPERYYVFSDDIAFCKERGKLYGFDKIEKKIEFVDVNHGTDSYNDLHLMTLCKYLIPALGSSFSRLAWILSEREMIVASSTSEIASWYS